MVFVKRPRKRLTSQKKAAQSFPSTRTCVPLCGDDAKEQVAYGLSKCDVLKISDNEIQWFTGEEDFDAGIAKLREQYNIPLIMLSLGRDGSRAYYKDLRVEVKPFLQDSTIETTGAGDTFGGCCLHYVLKYGLDNLDEEKLTEMLTFANAAENFLWK